MASRSLFPFFGGLPAERSGGVLDPFLQLRREMDRLFDDAFRGVGAPATAGAAVMAPRVDIKEAGDQLMIRADLPGVDQKDVEVTLDDDLLTIRGERKSERDEKEGDYHLMERSYGSFARSLRLPYSPKPDEVQAGFENGVLTVTLRRPQEQQGRRRIEVRSGGSAAQGRPAIDRAAAGDKPAGASGQAGEAASEEGDIAKGGSSVGP